MVTTEEYSLRHDAASILRQHVETICASDDSDAFKWLPADFPDRLMLIAWEHQFDIDKARFRRRLDQYLTEISQT